MSSCQTTLESLMEHVRETKLLQTMNATLEWDQQTGMPAKGAEYRSEQVKWLAGKIHQRESDPRVGEWLAELSESELAADPHSDTGCLIRELQHKYARKCRLPLELVQQQAQLHSRAQQIWIDARKTDDFPSFAGTLAEIFRLKREEAQAKADSDCLYDALLDDYEPGAKTAQVAAALNQLKDALVPLIAAATQYVPELPNPLNGHFPADKQRQFAIEATTAIGFDFERGRLDTAHHPFCTGLGPDDCRITTRYDESRFQSAFFGCLHEAGHGIYEQGLRADAFGLPAGDYCSLGIHESQSRLWENLVGRSRGFWNHFFPKAQAFFPETLADCNADEFHQAVNRIQPSLIRVEADEATYNLHIIVRFEIEQALLNGELPMDDLPGVWNQKYQDYLGIQSPTDADGVLQDIHWSAGLVGYFPTYSLGNLYASMLFDKAEADLGGLESGFESGDFAPLLGWLREQIHRPGNRYRASELMKKVAGTEIDHRPLVEHLSRKPALVE